MSLNFVDPPGPAGDWGDPQRQPRRPGTPKQMEESDRQEFILDVEAVRAERDRLLRCAEMYEASRPDLAAVARSKARTLQRVIDDYKHMSHYKCIGVAWTPPKGSNLWEAWRRTEQWQREVEQEEAERRRRRQRAQQDW